jgi:pyridoxamine 5'-phosphate oxidase family protein
MGRVVFTDIERRYLAAHPLGRLASIGPSGSPQIHPVAFRVDADTGTIDIGGPRLRHSQKFRNVQSDPRVSFVVDDQATPEESVHPRRVVAWDLDRPGYNSRTITRASAR